MDTLLVSDKKDENAHEKELEEGCEVLEAVKTIGRIFIVYYTNLKKESEG